MGQVSTSHTSLTLHASPPASDDIDLQEDHVVIGGTALPLNEILNGAFFAPEKIEALAAEFRRNAPFPHLVFEGLFNPRLLELIHADFDRLNWSDWRRFDNSHEYKLGSLPNTRFGNATQLYFNTIHSNAFIDFLQKVTGVDGLIPDPMLNAGGLHEIPKGGRFAMHIDFNQHPFTKLDNRLVFITYLNKDWLPSYGGALELQSMDDENCKVEIEPIFGRSALFYHSSKSFHGHPNPVNAPNGRARRSAAAYFYSNGRSDNETTDFHTTLFPKAIKISRHQKFMNVVKYVTPPVVVDAVRKFKAAFGGR